MKSTIILLLTISIVQSSFAQENADIKWWNPAESEFPVVSGQAWPHEVQSTFHRLPARAQEQVRTAVWDLSRQSAGLSVRFWTNASRIQIQYQVTGKVAFPHMPATGVSGVDLYSKSYDGEWMRCWGSYEIDKESSYSFVIDNTDESYSKYGREYQLFLPLYNEVEALLIGVDPSSVFEALPIRQEKPIVTYGTSICQGACASRPGMAWTNILERKLERPLVNLGFSGNGRLEPELIDLLAEIDAKLYILDCLPNLRPGEHDTYQLTLNAVKKLREKRPEVPIILTAHVGYADHLTNKKSGDKYLELNKELSRAFNHLKSEGYTKIFHLRKEDLGLNFDSYVDTIHPNDLGMLQYANAYENLIREVLNEPVGNIATTIPKTQSRDIAVYQWENRHQKVLELNKVNPPKTCLFGNSIVNFWGGAPKISVVNGKDSWEGTMEPLEIRNFGFGWDRIENVLWRIYHDELDGFAADQIILMIGTNNLHLNTETEIIRGLEELMKAIRTRQPTCKILMIGVLPRTGREQQVVSLNLKISQLADTEQIDYADIGPSLLLKDGRVDESLFSDGLHPNSKGYQIMARELQKLLRD
ncbi:MAG: SGNH/GDSL hydrolase family protein [Cyclobacteriaceae bacterium]|nr:SGNH/GDSL hydrolase family protein [Cyclobacteriaceae bacterium]